MMLPARTHRRTLRSLASALTLALACALGLSCGDEGSREDTLTIGVLLPFTGPSAGTASNFERAVLLAAERVNENGGVGGKKLRVVSRDTHSEVSRSERAVQQLLAEGALAVIGPESAEIAAKIAPTLAAHDVALVSPLVGAAADTGTDCERPWFRLAPSAKAMGESLAKLVFREKRTRVAIMFSSDAYDEALRGAFVARFTQLNRTAPLELRVEANAQTHAASLRSIMEGGVDSVVLATSPRTAALAINEFEAAGLEELALFLSPLLKTGLFVQNVAPAAVEGALGVAPSIFDTGEVFPGVFAERWRGDAPLEGAYFYYDATALVALALEKRAQAGAVGITLSLTQTILETAAPPGEVVQWDEVDVGLSRTREGADVYYAGLTGPVTLLECGERNTGQSTVWTIRDGLIEDEVTTP